MALVIADRVRETSTTTGTGDIVLGGAVAGFISFSSVMANTDTTYYGIVGGNSWEVGVGTYSTANNSISRTVVLSSSNGGSLVSFGSGTKNVFLTQPSERAVYVNGNTVVAANSATVPNSLLANSSVTFNGVTVALGGSGTITSSPTYPLVNASLSGTTVISGTANISATTTLSGTNNLTGTNTLTGTTTVTSATINGTTTLAGTITGTPTIASSSSLATQLATVNLGTFAITSTFPTNGASGTGSVATVTWATALAFAPAIGSNVIINGMTPIGYNGTYTVTASTTTSVSFASATSGGVSVQGTVQLTDWAPVYSQTFSVAVSSTLWSTAGYVTGTAYGGAQPIVYAGNAGASINALGDELEMDGLVVSAALGTTPNINVYVATTNGGPVVGPRQIALKLY